MTLPVASAVAARVAARGCSAATPPDVVLTMHGPGAGRVERAGACRAGTPTSCGRTTTAARSPRSSASTPRPHGRHGHAARHRPLRPGGDGARPDRQRPAGAVPRRHRRQPAGAARTSRCSGSPSPSAGRHHASSRRGSASPTPTARTTRRRCSSTRRGRIMIATKSFSGPAGLYRAPHKLGDRGRRASTADAASPTCRRWSPTAPSCPTGGSCCGTYTSVYVYDRPGTSWRASRCPCSRRGSRGRRRRPAAGRQRGPALGGARRADPGGGRRPSHRRPRVRRHPRTTWMRSTSRWVSWPATGGSSRRRSCCSGWPS